MLVARCMSVHPVTVPGKISVEAGRAVCERRKVHHLLVVENGEVSGITCLCDLEWGPPNRAVHSVMRSPVMTIGQADSCDEAARIMRECGVGCLVVTDDHGTVRGVVTRRDLRRAGTLPGEAGVDLCATCGSSHHLAPSDCPEVPLFCFDCLAQSRPPDLGDTGREMYFTLGGGD